MSDDDKFWNCATAVCVLLIGFLLGVIVESRDMKRRAVKAGVAEWIVNKETGSVTFSWKVDNK